MQAQHNDLTRAVRKLVATKDVEVKDYYNHTKVWGPECMEAWNVCQELRHRVADDQTVEFEFKGVDSFTVNVK